MWVSHRSIQSNYARANCAEIAALASLGLITTKITAGAFGRLWRITPSGMALINE